MMATMKRTPLARSTKPIRKVSKKRAAERPQRLAIVEEVMSKVAVCCLAPLGDCWGPSDPHEIVRRSASPGSHLKKELVVRICRKHHQIDDDDPELAQTLGIRIPGWAYRMYGNEAVAEAQRLRQQLWLGQRGEPFWMGEPSEAS